MALAMRKETENDLEYPQWLKTRAPFGGYTYKEYKNWDDSIRVELVDGMVYMMAGADERHQWISGDLFVQLGNQLKGKKCTPYIPPFDRFQGHCRQISGK